MCGVQEPSRRSSRILIPRTLAPRPFWNSQIDPIIANNVKSCCVRSNYYVPGGNQSESLERGKGLNDPAAAGDDSPSENETPGVVGRGR